MNVKKSFSGKIKLAFVITFISFFHSISTAQTAALNPDISLLLEINEKRTPFGDSFFLFATNTAWPVSYGGPVIFFSTGLITKDNETEHIGLEMMATQVVNSGITFGLKYIFNRSRPYTTYDFINAQIKNKLPDLSPSFPSGHTSIAFAFATSLTLNYPHWYVAVPAYLWASGVAYSRMYLGVHYPTDVLGGIIVGMGSAYLIHWLDKKYFPVSKPKKS